MAFSVGEIGLDLVLNSKGFQNQLGSINTKANEASSKISSSLKKIGVAVAAAFSIKAIVTFGKQCIDLGSNLAEVQNVVDVTFKSMSGNVNQWAKDAAGAYGLSETMAKKYVGTFGSMAEAFGFTEKQSYDMATALTGLSGDVASFYNISQDEAYIKLKSVFSGETETLKDLGIVMTQSALDSYALANGYGKVTSKMTEAEKVSLRLAFVQGQLKNATGDFARTQDSWANQTRVLQLRFESLKATLGQGLINAFAPVLKVVNTLMASLTSVTEKFKDFTEQVFGSAGGDADSATNSISDTVDSVSSLTDTADDSSSALDSVADSAEKAKRSVAGFDKLNVLSSSDTVSTTTAVANPTTSSTKPTSTTAMASAVDKFANSWNSKGQKVINSIKKAFGNIKGAVKAIDTSWSEVWNNGSGKKLVDNIKILLSNCFDIIGDIAGAFTKTWKKGDIGNQVVQSIIDRCNSLIELVNTVADDFKEVWNDGTGERIWFNILSAIKNCNDYVSTFRDKVKQAWEKNDTGKKIWQDILGIVEDITAFLSDISQIRLDWISRLNLSPLMESVEKLVDAFRGLLDVCGNQLKIVYKNVLLPLSKWTIEKALPKLINFFADALKILGNVISKISPSTLDAIAGALVSFGTALILFKTGTAISKGISQVESALGLLFTSFEAHPYIALASGLAIAITGLVTAIQLSNDTKFKDLGFEDYSNTMQDSINIIDSYKDSIKKMCSEVSNSLNDTSTQMGVIDSYKQRLDELLTKANLSPSEQAELTTIADYFSSQSPEFKEAWDSYVTVNSDGTVKLNGNVDDVIFKLDDLIDKYKKVAATAAITNLSQQSETDFISAQKDVTNAAKAYKTAQKALSDFKKEWNLTDNNLKSLNNSPDFYTWQNSDKSRNSSAGDLKKEYQDLVDSLGQAELSYNDTAESTAQLKMNSDDLARMQAVVNGNYEDASAVLMAYNTGLITTEDVQNSQWETLNNLQSAAQDSGKNFVFGMSTGIDSYKDEIKNSGLQMASLLMDNLNGPDGLDEHSPSKKTYLSGVNAVLGLVNAISDTAQRVKGPIQSIVDQIKEKLEPVKTVFVNVFSGIWAVIKNPLNWLMYNLENFINGFIGGINAISSGADWAVNNIGQLFGQEWHVGRLDNVKLPRFAKGAIVKAPTLALVGDNAGANTGNPEVVAPLNKLQSMINTTSNSSDITILMQILDYLKKLYEMFIVFRNNGGNAYQFIAQINGSEIFDEMIKQDQLYKKRHNGQSAFA